MMPLLKASSWLGVWVALVTGCVGRSEPDASADDEGSGSEAEASESSADSGGISVGESTGTASGGDGSSCNDECIIDADCPEQQACFEIFGDACGFVCDDVECTLDEHCPDGGVCSYDENTSEGERYRCLPATCAGATLVGPVDVDTPEDVAALASIHCVHGTLRGTALSSLVGLEALELVTGTLWLAGSPALTDLEGLSGLVEVGSLELDENALLTDITALVALARAEGVYIQENPQLPAVQIDELLAHVEVAGIVEHCGNLGDRPCPPPE